MLDYGPVKFDGTHKTYSRFVLETMSRIAWTIRQSKILAYNYRSKNCKLSEGPLRRSNYRSFSGWWEESLLGASKLVIIFIRHNFSFYPLTMHA